MINFDDDSTNPIAINPLDPDNIWQIGFTAKFEGSNSIYHRSIITDSVNHYPVNNYSVFEINIAGWYQEGFMLDFDHKYDTEKNKDGGMIEIYNKWSKEWNGVYDFPNEIYFNGYNRNDTVSSLNGKPGFSGNMENWEHVMLTIHNYPFELDTFKLRFVFASDSIDNNDDGWIIDNIFLGGMYESISNLAIKSKIIYPNPFTDRIYFVDDLIEDYGDIDIRIYNQVGTIEFQQKEISKSIDLTNLLPGIYLIRFQGDNYLYIQKIIKLNY